MPYGFGFKILANFGMKWINGVKSTRGRTDKGGFREPNFSVWPGWINSQVMSEESKDTSLIKKETDYDLTN